jgi:hypothetical protein
MKPWEYETETTCQPLVLDGHFSTEEITRLHALRQHVLSHPASLELGIDERRLTFARWLVEHGKLSESF